MFAKKIIQSFYSNITKTSSSRRLCSQLATQTLPYKGQLIKISEIPNNQKTDKHLFGKQLQTTIENLQQNQMNSVWLDIPIENADFIKYVHEQFGFDFHHVNGNNSVMKKWINPNSPDTIPVPLTTHQIACAGLVTNKNKEMLVIKEGKRHNNIPIQWKLPGGLLDVGENIEDGVEREVFEETGVQGEFQSVLGFWNKHDLSPWGQSDIYVVSHLTTEETDIPNIDCNELSKARWMSIKQFIENENHPLVNPILQKYFNWDTVYLNKNKNKNKNKLGLKRIDVNWQDHRGLCPTYI